MSVSLERYAQVDGEGRLVLPPQLASLYGIKPYTRLIIAGDGHTINLLRSPTQLSKLYIEPTNLCNLACSTCVRSVWHEPMGEMSGIVFNAVMDGLRTFSPVPGYFSVALENHCFTRR